MKRNYPRVPKIKNKWYLVCDGKNAYVTTDISEAKTLNVVILSLTPNQAATLLALRKGE